MSKGPSWVPWYRRKDCGGNLSEEDKRLFDLFRIKDKRPACVSRRDSRNDISEGFPSANGKPFCLLELCPQGLFLRRLLKL